MKGSLLMSSKEHERIQMLEAVKKRKLTIREASELCRALAKSPPVRMRL